METKIYNIGPFQIKVENVEDSKDKEPADFRATFNYLDSTYAGWGYTEDEAVINLLKDIWKLWDEITADKGWEITNDGVKVSPRCQWCWNPLPGTELKCPDCEADLIIIKPKGDGTNGR